MSIGENILQSDLFAAAPMSRRSFVGACTALGLLGLTGTLSGCASTWEASALDRGAAGSDATAARPIDVTAGGEAAEDSPSMRTFFAFDTVITLSAYADEAQLEALEERCRYFESCFSRTLEGSDVWHINRAGGAPTKVAPETADLIVRALEYSRRSDGLFDITIGAVTSLWDFKTGIRPTDAALTQALAHVGWEGVHVEGSTVRLDDPEAMIDLGGIAKGYIADDLAERLRAAGCESALINLGGNVVAVGTKPSGEPWNVGIQDPNAATGAGVIAALPCRDKSVVTSGLYERCFEENGIRYHHILDPRTGYPAQTDLLASSIVSSSSTEADALATWLFLVGGEQALANLESMADVEGLAVRADSTVITTTGADFELR